MCDVDSICRGSTDAENSTIDAPAALEESCHAIAAFHERQDPVGAALEAKVQMRADTLRLAQGIDQLAAHLGRLETAEPQAKIAGQRIKAPQFHMFYGFVAIIAVGIIYSYRAQLRHRIYLLYGLGGLFVMGLGIRALLVGKQ